MTEQVETYITDELRAQIGVETDRRVSYPVSESDIRKWAIAVYWPETPPRLFWDAEYAKKTRFGGIVAPEDFNPFAWPPERTREPMSPTAGRGQRGMNGGGEATYYARIRPGDIITSVSKLVDVYERQTSLGLTLFRVTETRWTNQRGELVKIYRGTGITY